MNILLTSGGTSIPIDNVRSIKNFSSGKFGSIIAKQALLAGHNVTQLHAVDAPTPFEFKVDLLKSHQDYVSKLDAMHEFSKKYMKNYSHFTFDTFGSYIGICLSGKPYLIELNSFSCSGFYDCNIPSIIRDIRPVVIKDFENYHYED